ncbi:MAG: VOC family protein [Pseudomonadota bacterium]|nr:VOC family protein [Pseudomonadota bacterium]
MSLNAITHLNFRGNAGTALNFYQQAFDGQLSIVTYQDAGQAGDADDAGQVMWGQVTTASGLRLMGFDILASRRWHPGENAVFVVVEGSNAADITAPWEQLCNGATILQALAPMPWAPLYGMVKDRFGITWVLSIARQE